MTNHKSQRDRRQRQCSYANLMPLGKQHNQRALTKLKEQGIELTEEQLIAERKAAYENIRKGLRERGIQPPTSDIELFKIMHMNDNNNGRSLY